MFFKPVKSIEWLSPDFLEKLTSLEKHIDSDALSKPAPQQLFSKLMHLIHAFPEILIAYLNLNIHGELTIRKLSIFVDVSDILSRLNNCNQKLNILLTNSSSSNKKLKINETQSSGSSKQEETNLESTISISHKRKFSGNQLEKLEEVTKLITLISNISMLVNTSLNRFEQDVFAGLEDLAIIKIRQEQPLTPEEISLFNTFPVVPALMKAMYSVTQQILSEIDFNKPLLDVYKNFEEIKKSKNSGNTEDTGLGIMALSLGVQDVITLILKKQTTFIKKYLATDIDRIALLQSFTALYPAYNFEAIEQLLIKMSAEIKSCFLENSEEDQKFLKNIELEVNDINAIKHLMLSAKEILDEYLLTKNTVNTGKDTAETIKNLESQWQNLHQFKNNFTQINPNNSTSSLVCDFLIETTKHAIGCLKELYQSFLVNRIA